MRNVIQQVIRNVSPSSPQIQSLTDERQRLFQQAESTKQNLEAKMSSQKGEMRKLVEIVRRAKDAEAERKEEAERLAEEAKEAKTKTAQLKAKIKEAEDTTAEMEQRLADYERYAEAEYSL